MIVPWFIVSGNIHDTQSGVGCVETTNWFADET